ncbi:MAG: cytochrome c [Bradyrhizobium sp.]
MRRIFTIVGTLLLSASVVSAQQDQVATTQAAMKSNLRSAATMNGMVKGEKPYDQAAVDKSLAELEDVAKRFASLFPESIKGLKPGGDYYASDKVWTDRAGFEARVASFTKVVGEAKSKIKDLDSLKATFPSLSKECMGCHETYRVKL